MTSRPSLPDFLLCDNLGCDRVAGVFMVGREEEGGADFIYSRKCLRCADGGKGDFERRLRKIWASIQDASGVGGTSHGGEEPPVPTDGEV